MSQLRAESDPPKLEVDARSVPPLSNGYHSESESGAHELICVSSYQTGLETTGMNHIRTGTDWISFLHMLSCQSINAFSF